MKKPMLVVLMLALLAAAVWRLRAEPGEAVAPRQSLDSMTRDELYELARQLDIPGRSRMKKTELRAALSRAGRSG
jgi:hypothetical protein